MRDRKVSWPEYENKEANLFALIMDIRKEREEEKEKALTCDMCGTAGDEENEVWEWGNPYDFGTICADCQETVNDSR